jgi:hypothetical protein
MENSENYSCVDCIWHDQCESDVLCDFFDSGRSGESLTDDEIESGIELNRQEYKKAYAEYVGEYSDGNIDPSEMLEPEFEEESEMEGLDDLS